MQGYGTPPMTVWMHRILSAAWYELRGPDNDFSNLVSYGVAPEQWAE